MIEKSQITAFCAGKTVFKELDPPQGGRVTGITSCGIFLLTDRAGIIFLSYEAYRGPLTVNLLDLPPEVPPSLVMGASLALTPGCLSARDGQFELLLPAESGWSSPAAPLEQVSPLPVRLARLHSFCRLALSRKHRAGFAPVLPDLLDWPGAAASPHVWDSLLAARVQNVLALPRLLQFRAVPQVTANLGQLLGCGRGLTPSGDDLVLGLLLVANRWGAGGLQDEALARLNAEVVAAARQRTTTLSARLIECAAQGEADERLLAAADYLFSGAGDEGKVLEELLTWGASSGVDALVGMAVVI
ncbi:MAG: DUF2877 domain-containing protein [Chloroflexi bacterium]|nr:DUF2877 domain-containing protein [Chloroflexota bacterium]